MTAHTLPPVSYNPDEDWLRPIVGALLVHLLVVLIFGLAWLWSPTRNTRVAAGEGTLEASLELSGAEIAAAQRALNQSIAQSGNAPIQPVAPSRQTLPSPTVEPTRIPETVVPIIVPDTREHMRSLAEQQRQQEEAERQRQAELLAEQQRQQEEAERQRQAELLAEQQRQQEEAERQRQAELLAEQQRQQAEAEQLAQQQQEEAQRQQRIAELRQRREQVEQQAAQEQQRLDRIRAEQQRANQAVATSSNAAATSSSSTASNSGTGSASGSAGGDSNELLASYKAAIQNAILRQWTRPESIPLGQTCRLTINQIPGGQVINVQFTPECPYDEAGRRSVERAILRASPLPHRGFENVFDRTLHFNFTAQD